MSWGRTSELVAVAALAAAVGCSSDPPDLRATRATTTTDPAAVAGERVGVPTNPPPWPGEAAEVRTVGAFGSGAELDGSLWVLTGPEDDPDTPWPVAVVELDGATGEVVRTIEPGGADVRDLDAGAGFVWVTTSEGVVRVDPASGATDLVPLDEGGDDVVVADGGVWVVTGSLSDDEVWIVDPTTLAAEPVDLEIEGATEITALATDGSTVWMANEDGQAHIEVYDATTGERRRTMPSPFARPVVTLAAAGDRWWACRPQECVGFEADGDEPDLRLDLGTDITADEGEGPADSVADLVADADGHLVLLLEGGAHDAVSMVDPTTGAVTATFTSWSDDRVVALAAGAVWLFPDFDGVDQADHSERLDLPS